MGLVLGPELPECPLKDNDVFVGADGALVLGGANWAAKSERLAAASAASNTPRVPLDIFDENESDDELYKRGSDMGDSPNEEQNDGEMV